MYTITGAKPNDVVTRCIRVTYTGSRPPVRLYTTTPSTRSDSTSLSIDKGTMPGATFPNCTGFTPTPSRTSSPGRWRASAPAGRLRYRRPGLPGRRRPVDPERHRRVPLHADHAGQRPRGGGPSGRTASRGRRRTSRRLGSTGGSRTRPARAPRRSRRPSHRPDRREGRRSGTKERSSGDSRLRVIGFVLGLAIATSIVTVEDPSRRRGPRRRRDPRVAPTGELGVKPSARPVGDGPHARDPSPGRRLPGHEPDRACSTSACAASPPRRTWTHVWICVTGPDDEPIYRGMLGEFRDWTSSSSRCVRGEWRKVTSRLDPGEGGPG